MPKTDNFRQIIDKINRAFEKTHTNIHAKFQTDRCNLFRVIARKKIDNSQTNTWVLIDTFSEDDFFAMRIICKQRQWRNSIIVVWHLDRKYKLPPAAWAHVRTLRSVKIYFSGTRYGKILSLMCAESPISCLSARNWLWDEHVAPPMCENVHKKYTAYLEKNLTIKSASGNFFPYSIWLRVKIDTSAAFVANKRLIVNRKYTILRNVMKNIIHNLAERVPDLVSI